MIFSFAQWRHKSVKFISYRGQMAFTGKISPESRAYYGEPSLSKVDIMISWMISWYLPNIMISWYHDIMISWRQDITTIRSRLIRKPFSKCIVTVNHFANALLSVFYSCLTLQPVHEINLPTTNSTAFLNRVTLTVFTALIFFFVCVCVCSSGASPRQFHGRAQPSS